MDINIVEIDMAEINNITPIARPPKSDYFKNYYHEKVRKVHVCLFCGSQVIGSDYKIHKHLQTKKCSQVRSLLFPQKEESIMCLNPK